MNNNFNIIQLEHFDIDNLKNILTLENPIYQGNTNYFSKLVFKENKKNVYFQLPKTKSKQGLVINGTKKYIEFIYTKNDKYIFSFIENLEGFLIDEILKNKDMWFYNSDSISYDDIENIIMPITKSYKNGNNVLLKTYFNLNKLIIYNENKEVIEYDKFNANDYIIPLINVNGIKFSNKNFIIDINLLQLLVISDEEDLTNSLLINISNKNNLKYNSNQKDLEKKEIQQHLKEEEYLKEEVLKEHDLKEEVLKEHDLKEEVLKEHDLKEEVLKEHDLKENNLKEHDLKENNLKEHDLKENNLKKHDLKEDDLKEDDLKEDDLKEDDLKEKDLKEDDLKEKDLKEDDLKEKDLKEDDLKEKDLKEDDLKEEDFNDIIDITNNMTMNDKDNNFINIKTREHIYLDMYNDAIKKAISLKKTAIESFLKAKKIKNDYDLGNLIKVNGNYSLSDFEDLEEL